MKAGQKVIVLKSPKGICLQLESGKVIAIRASVKGGQHAPGIDQKLGSFSALAENVERPKLLPGNEGDVIDISNDDDEEVSQAVKSIMPVKTATPPTNGSEPNENISASDPVYKEKVVYKPNLVHRSKPKMPPPAPDTQRFDSSYQSQQRPQSKWESHKNFPTSSSSIFSRSINGSSKSQTETFRNRKYQLTIWY